MSLLRENLLDTLRLRSHLRINRISLTLRRPAQFFSLGLRVNDSLLLLDLSRNHDIGLLGSLLPGSTCKLGTLLSLVSLLHRLCSLNLLGGNRNPGSLSLLLTPYRIRIRNGNLGIVLSFNSLCIGISSRNPGISHSLGNTDILVPVRLSLTDFTETILLGNTLLGIIDSLCRSLLSESLDIAGLIADISNIDIDKLQSDFAELRLDVCTDIGKELVAVRVDFLDIHRRDDKPQLTEKDISRDILDILDSQPEKSLSRIGHIVRLRRDSNGKSARHIHTDILLAERIGQIALDRNRSKIQKSIALEHRPDERSTSVDTLCRGRSPALVLSRLSVNHENFIRRTTLVASQNSGERHYQHHHRNGDKNYNFHIYNVLWFCQC